MTATTFELARRTLDPRKLALPSRPVVESIEVEEMVDWTVDERLRIQVIIGEDSLDEELSGKFGAQLKFAIRDTLAAQSIEDFPYVNLAKQSNLDVEEQENPNNVSEGT